jgi:hypothetical protein
MDKERELYDKFVDVLSARLDGAPSPKDLEVVMKFLQNNNIQATTKHTGLSDLATKATSLPFEDEDELPSLRIVK